jgi:hypothetical protein
VNRSTRRQAPLAEYAWQWLEERPNLRPRTYELYQGELRLHILPALGSVEQELCLVTKCNGSVVAAFGKLRTRGWIALRELSSGRPPPPIGMGWRTLGHDAWGCRGATWRCGLRVLRFRQPTRPTSPVSHGNLRLLADADRLFDEVRFHIVAVGFQPRGFGG